MAGIIITADEDVWSVRQKQAANRVAEKAMQSKSIEVTSNENLVVRGLLPAEDLDSGSENAWSSDKEWRQDFNNNGSATSFNEAYQIDPTSNAEDKIIGIYGISLFHTSVDTRTVRVAMGKNGVNGIHSEVNVEMLEADQESRALFTGDIVVGAKEHAQISHWTESADDDNRIAYHGFVAEAVGDSPYSRAHFPNFC